MRRWLFLLTLCVPMWASAQSPEQVLPGPQRLREGSVPHSEPIAPVPKDPAWALSLTGAVGLADAFHSKVAFTFAARRSLGWLSVGGYAGRALSWADPALELCAAPGACTTPAATRLVATPGRIDWMGGLGVGLRTAEGKLSLGGLGISHFRLDSTVDASFVGYTLEDGDDSSRWAPGVRLGVNASAGIGSGWSLGVSLASLLYLPSIRGEREFERQLMLGVGIGFRPGAE